MKAVAFAISGSLSVLAALVDSVLDVIGQSIMFWAEKKGRLISAALYPSGGSRFEPIGIILCAAIMGMGSVLVIQEALTSFAHFASSGDIPMIEGGLVAPLSMAAVITTKILLYAHCRWVASLLSASGESEGTSFLEAIAQDHLNDILSNSVAVAALCLARVENKVWFLDPLGALLISLYILWSWYHTGKEEIEKIAGKAAGREFVDKL